MEHGSGHQAEETVRQVNDPGQMEVSNFPFRLTSVDRVSKLPVVEESVKMVNSLYGKFRGANPLFNWSMRKAESTALKVANVTAPVLIKLQGPIETLDGVLCVGLDYVESKVPAIKLPPNEIYVNTKQSVSDSIQPCVNRAAAMKNYGATKLVEVCRVCGVCEPGASDAPDTQEENELTRKALELSMEFGTTVKLWIFHKLYIFIADPRDVELILGNSTHLEKAEEYRFFKPWLGDGLLISSGQKWKSHRKLIAPTFHLNVLKSFVDLFNVNSGDVCEKMAKENGKAFDCHEYMSECTVEILLETAMGVSKKTQGKSGFEYAMAVMKMCSILQYRQSKVWLRPDWLFSFSRYGKEQIDLLGIIHGLTKKVIKRKKEQMTSGDKNYIESTVNPEENSVSTAFKALKDDLDDQDENDVGQKKRLAFLDLMVETAQNGAVLTDDEIKEEVDTIMFEGHDTTAAGSSFFLCLMGLHQNYQEMCVQELNQIFGDSDRPATFADTLQMKFLERCLLETLRMYPPVPIIARKLQEDVKLVSNDYVLPKGATVVIGTQKTHRLEEHWENPDVFNPDNHLPEKAADRHFYSFIPFSAGPRSCVGRKYALLKLKILLSTILRNFKVYSDIKEDDYRLQGDIILKRADGFMVRLEPRKKNLMASPTM